MKKSVGEVAQEAVTEKCAFCYFHILCFAHSIHQQPTHRKHLLRAAKLKAKCSSLQPKEELTFFQAPLAPKIIMNNN